MSAFAVFSALLVGGGGWLWSHKDSPSTLSYRHFTPLRLQAITPVNSESSILTLEVPRELLPDPAMYPEPANTPLQAIYIRQPELQIQRAYTPLSLDCFDNDINNETGTMRILVKRYNDGEVSSYLHRLKKGDIVFVRGPVRTWTLPHCDELIFVCTRHPRSPCLLINFFSRSLEEPALLL